MPLEPADPRPRRGPVLLLGVLAALALIVVLGHEDPPPAPPPGPPVDAALTLVADAVSVTQSGVLVVPVLLQDRGPGLRVVDATAYAEPVRTDPAVEPPLGVAPGASRRFVVLLAPDCRLLSPRSGIAFNASLLVRVTAGDAEQQLVLPLGAEPSVLDRVTGLCRRAP